MIKLIIFDLDGVLVDSRDLHYYALNRALESIDVSLVINREEHLSMYDGLPTSKKLELLTKNKGLDVKLYDKIWKLKQEMTQRIIDEEYQYDERIRGILRCLKNKKYEVHVASNSIYNTIKMMLLRKGFLEYIDYFVSNQEVRYSKPHPEMYFKCMVHAHVTPKETLILEDSHIGRKAVNDSGSYLLAIENPMTLNLDDILSRIDYIDMMNEGEMNQGWDGELNVVIPMAGAGSRFKKVGYTFPKPLIDINGKPMIQVVVENLNLKKAKYHFIVQEDHYKKYNLKHLLQLIAPNCVIIQVNDLTEGAACTVLLAEEYIDNSEHLLIVNSDQYLEWNSNEFMYSMCADEIDGGISTFESVHPRWSYAKLDDDGFVSEVAEKNPISKHATTGIYYWKRGSDYVKYANRMMEKEVRVNGEYYVCPVYNEAIGDGRRIKIKDCDRMWGLGTPEDLDNYLKNFTK